MLSAIRTPFRADRWRNLMLVASFLPVTLLALLLAHPAAAQAPTLTALAPARNALTAPRNADVTATFSLPLSATSTSGIKVFGGQAGGLKAGAATVNGGTLTFNPTVNFRPGETIRTTFTAAVRSTGGVALTQPLVTQFTAATGTGPATFLGGPLLATSGVAGSIATGDIDGDGDEDIVASVSSSGSVVSQLNDGVGQFQAGPVVVLGSGVGAGVVTLGDVDNDGDLDLLVGLSGSVAVRLNNGTGAFTGSLNVPLPVGAYQIVLADLDGDADLDLLTASYNVACVRLNDGAGHFTGTTNLGTGNNNSALAVGDVDGDGDLDVVTTTNVNNNFTIGYARVWRNLGTGTFNSAYTSLDTTPLPGSAFLVDIDADADLDLLVGSSNSGQVSVLRNSGTGTFTPDPNVPLNGRALGAVADLDGDGDADLLGYDFNSSQLSVVLNDGTGAFGVPRLAPLGNVPYVVAVADFDGDAALDVVAPHENAVALQVLFNHVPPPVITGFSPTSGPVGTLVTLTGTGLREVRRVSFNQTVAPGFTTPTLTRLTVRVPAGATTGRIRVMNPGGTAVTATDFIVTGPPAPTVVGLDPARNAPAAPLAASVDITFSQAISAASGLNVRVFGSQRRGARAGASTGGGTTSLSFQPTQPFAPGERVSVSVPATVQNAAGTGVPPQVYDFTAAAAPAQAFFTSLPSIPFLNGTPRSTALADVDADGDQDLVVLAENQGLLVRLNDGTGNCTGTGRLAVSGGQYLVMGDVDADGDLDALIASGAGLIVCRNNGAGVFAALPAVPAGRDTNHLTVADLDGDGDLDALLANYSSGSVSVRFNDGTGVFSGTTDEPVGTQPWEVAAGDVDNDGDIDFVTANIGAGTASVRFNDGVGGFLAGPEVAVGPQCSAVALGDLDGDGTLDLATRFAYQFDTVSVFHGTGTGQFDSRVDRVLGRYLNNIVLADMNGDAHLDLVVCVQIDGGIVWLNDGTGSFAPAAGAPTGIPTGSVGPVRHVATADMDGDGTLDMVTTDLYYVGPTAVVQLNAVPLATPAPVAASASTLALWPNPARGVVQLSVPAGTATVTLLDAIGRSVRTLTFDPQAAPVTRVLSLAGVARGVYAVRCGGLTQRLVVE